LTLLTPHASRLTSRNTARRAVFLDRDGTINVEKDYLYRVEDFAFLAGAPQAIKSLKDAGFLVIVVTNQSGVARGYFDEADVDRLHRHIQAELARYATAIDAFYVCPHHPQQSADHDQTPCNCRKGKPGMLLQAAADFDIDLSSSWMVGDKLADVQAGEGAGCRPILVLTGYGSQERLKLDEGRAEICADLIAAANLILAGS